MPTKPERIECPKYPPHGIVTIRPLPPEKRQCITAERDSDVFEVDCPVCGKYEFADKPPTVNATSAGLRVGSD